MFSIFFLENWGVRPPQQIDGPHRGFQQHARRLRLHDMDADRHHGRLGIPLDVIGAGTTAGTSREVIN